MCSNRLPLLVSLFISLLLCYFQWFLLVYFSSRLYRSFSVILCHYDVNVPSLPVYVYSISRNKCFILLQNSQFYKTHKDIISWGEYKNLIYRMLIGKFVLRVFKDLISFHRTGMSLRFPTRDRTLDIWLKTQKKKIYQ